MTLKNFAKNMNRMRTHRTPPRSHRAAKQIEIIDDVVTIGSESKQWDKTERNGRIYLTRL